MHLVRLQLAYSWWLAQRRFWEEDRRVVLGGPVGILAQGEGVPRMQPVGCIQGFIPKLRGPNSGHTASLDLSLLYSSTPKMCWI